MEKNLEQKIPRDDSFDSTPRLLSEGYEFISNRCRLYRSDIFETRLMLRKATCTMGEDAARMFYYPDRFTRKRAMPPTALMSLQDKGSVQTLSGEAHRWRKQMFMSLMSPLRVRQLVDATADRWRAWIGKWETMDRIVLHHEVRGILCRSVCEWAGVPLTEPEARERTREFGSMIDGAGAVGPRNWWVILLRSRTERWLRHIIEKARTRKLDAPEESAAHIIAMHRGLDGKLLDTSVAAVELLNVLRPTVAVAWYVTFAALALHDYPDCRRRLRSGDDEYLDMFVREVRRFYPFFPAIGGRVAEEFDWRGRRFSRGTWVLLDLYGTLHDPRIWTEPEAFRPERFRNWDGNAFTLIPQGAGGYSDGHRCPGEWITIEIVKEAVRLLTTAMSYSVPKQDLRVLLSRMPAVPQSRFVISNVRGI